VRSPNVSDLRRSAPVALFAAAIVVTAPNARADDKQTCADAYAQTQTLRQAGQLRAAHEQALLCVKDVCPEFIRSDCGTWLGEIAASQPTVVLDVRDGAGQSVLDASISLDGKPWLATIDASAHEVDPGTHVLRLSRGDAPPVEQSIIVREGDKNQKIVVTVATPGASAVPPPTPGPDAVPPPRLEGESPTVAPWIIGGAGVATLAVGAILGVVVLGDKSTFDEHCDAEAKLCDAEGGAARDSGESLAPVSTTLILLGGAAVGVSAVWILTRDSGSAEAAGIEVHTGPVVGHGSATWRLGGSF